MKIGGTNKGKTSRLYSFGVIVVGVLAVIIGCCGITYVAPSYMNDSWIRIPFAMVFDRMEPGVYSYPSLYFDVVALLYRLFYCFLRATHQIKSTVDFFADYFFFRTADFFAIARVVSAVSFGGVVIMTARIGRRLWNCRSGFTAAFLVLCSKAFLNSAGMERADMLAVFLTMAAFDMSLTAAERPGAARFAASGMLAGLAASADYVGVLSLIFPLWAFFACLRKGNIKWRMAALAVASAAAAFVFTSPYAVISFGQFSGDFLNFARSLSGESESAGKFYSIMYLFKYGGVILPAAFPWLIFAAFRGNPKEKAAFFYMASFIILFAIVFKTDTARMLPMIPFMLLFAARFLDWLVTRIGFTYVGTGIFVLIFALSFIMIVPAHLSSLPGSDMRDTRTEASKWLSGQAKPGETVLYETDTIYYLTPNEIKRNFTPTPSEAGKAFFYYSSLAFQSVSDNGDFKEPGFKLVHLSETNLPNDGKYYSAADVERFDARWIVLNGNMKGRASRIQHASKDGYGKIVEFYKWVESHCVMEKRLVPAKAVLGPEIIIYRRPETRGAAKVELEVSAAERLTPCTLPACVSLLKILEKKTGGKDIQIYGTSDRGINRIMIDASVPGEGQRLRLSLISNPRADLNCFINTRNLCVQYYGRGDIGRERQAVIDEIMDALEGWRGAEEIH